MNTTSPILPGPNTLHACDLLALGDSKVALSTWYFATVFNGRSVADFATLLALGQTSLGHARAIYQHLVDYGYDYTHLERGRIASEVNSMGVLDTPPSCWEDLMATTIVVENAMWAVASGFVGGNLPQLAMLIQKIGKEKRFHLLYAIGWLDAFDDEERARFKSCLDQRVARAREWLGPVDELDDVHRSGARTTTNTEVHALFDAEMVQAYAPFGLPVPAADVLPAWDRTRRRTGSLPESLYQRMKPRDL